MKDDFLVELGVEELPSRSLIPLQHSFSQNLQAELQKKNLNYDQMKFFISPRRIAALVIGLDLQQKERINERIGPSIQLAYDKEGNPTPAAEGFAKSCKVPLEKLETKETPKGKCLYFSEKLPGKTTLELLPELISSAVNNIHITKPMRWGKHASSFIRPVRWIALLLGDKTVSSQIMGLTSGNITFGHRFHAPSPLTIKKPQEYEDILKTRGFVIPNYQERKKIIRQQIEEVSQGKGQALIDEDLLDEVTGLVEWPQALVGSFDPRFLNIPHEVLISSMKTHQRYFPIVDTAGKLQPYFVFVSNIESKNPKEVIIGNERVLCARLSDAEFFFHTDSKHGMEYHLEQLKQVIFQIKLGTMYEKAVRIAQLSHYMANLLNENPELSYRAGLLSKADLTTEMVGEFPELQGVMGYYYALKDNEESEVANAIKQHYQPRFAGDELPNTQISRIVSIADKLDTLLGIFAIQQAPTGEKDPFALRRAALGVLRIMIETDLDLDLRDLLTHLASYQQHLSIEPMAINQTLDFMLERLRTWYLDQGVSPEIFSAVLSRFPTRPLDFDARIKAVQHFLQLPDAFALSAANKRVNNILKQAAVELPHSNINYGLLESDTERNLVELLEQKTKEVERLCHQRQYQEALTNLSKLREAIDRFFDEVMVMVDDKNIRVNRLILLNNLRNLFLQIADISLLQ